MSDLEGVQLTYNTSVTFSTLRSSDSGSYICSAAVTPQESNSNLIQSNQAQGTINISVGMLLIVSLLIPRRACAVRTTVVAICYPKSHFTSHESPHKQYQCSASGISRNKCRVFSDTDAFEI